MARAGQDKAYRTFLNGLVTEATGLTFPENSLRDVDNCDIELKGLIRRRLGIAQEPGGTTVGPGSLDTIVYANNTGGPLSSNPYQSAASFNKYYDGVTGNADWTLGAYDPDSASATIDDGMFRLRSDRYNYAYMSQDFQLEDYDYISLTFTEYEGSENEPNFSVGLGVDSTGVGTGFTYDRGGLYYSTFTGRPGNEQTRTLIWETSDHYLERETTFTFTMAKTADHTYATTIQVIKNGIGVWTGLQTIGTVGGFIELRNCSRQKHHSYVLVDKITVTGEAYENDGDTGSTTVDGTETAITSHTWANVGGIDGKSWVVFQIGNQLHFRDHLLQAVSVKGGTVPLASSVLNFDGAGVGFVYNTTAAEAAKVKLQSATGNGRIWFTSSAVVPFYAEYDADLDSIVLRPNGYQATGDSALATTGARRIRDFNGAPDQLANDTTPPTLSPEHLYNLLNQGWPSNHIQSYFDEEGSWPSNAQQWVIGKDNTDDFSPALLVKQDFGNSPAPRGRHIIDALLGDKDGVVHGVTGVTNPLNFDGAYDEKSSTGWSAVGFYAGRVWYAGDSNAKRPNGVYFSKTLSTPRDSGTFMQENDPTSDQFSDLVDTDGGVIYIPEADRIMKLQPFGVGLLVMAQNGVWFISGGQSGFVATSFSVDKVSSTGIISAETAITTDQSVVFWADNGVQVLALPDQGTIPVVQDISQTKVFELYNNIPLAARVSATGAFDRITKKVYWLWLQSDTEAFGNLYNQALIYDTRTNAFTKYSFRADSANSFGVVGAFHRLSPTQAYIQQAVTTVSGELVYDTGGDVVTAYGLSQSIAGLQNSLKLVIVDGTDKGLRLADFSNRNFEDFFGFENSDAVNFVSYLITGDETLGDLQRNKQATYIHSFFRRTETGYIEVDGIGLVPLNQSGCTMRAQWDWNNTSAGGRWSDSQMAYRYRRPYLPTDVNSSLDTGEEIVYTKLKARGKGRALSARFTSVDGKDFQLLGFSIPFTASGV